MQHHCGVLALVAPDLRAPSVVHALHQLQHRGYESAGVAYTSAPGAKRIWVDKGIGLVRDVFDDSYQFAAPKPVHQVIGHVRYSTVPKQADTASRLRETQPLQSAQHPFALAHNGNVPEMGAIMRELGVSERFNSDSVAMVVLLEHWYRTYEGDWTAMLSRFVERVAGSYCLVILTPDAVYAVRDRYGFRPLYVAYEPDQKRYCVASETVAFTQRSERSVLREVRRGEVLRIRGADGLSSLYQAPQLPRATFCSFESIYFMHYESTVGADDAKARRVGAVREALGRALGALEAHPLPPDAIVACVPNTSIPAAQGYATAVQRPFVADLLVRNSRITRTFILPTKAERQQACDAKFIYNTTRIRDAIIYLVDDSIVRGTTMQSVVRKLRACGAKAVHVRIPSPIIRAPCYFGIDMATREEMVSYDQRDETAISKALQLDSVRYLPLETMQRIFKETGVGDGVCTSCFTGRYPPALFDW